MATTYSHLGCDINHRSRGAAERCKYGPSNPSSPSAGAAAAREIERRRMQAQKETERKRRREAAVAAKTARKREREQARDTRRQSSGARAAEPGPSHGQTRGGALPLRTILLLTLMALIALFFLLMVIAGLATGEIGLAVFSLVVIGLLAWLGHRMVRKSKGYIIRGDTSTPSRPMRDSKSPADGSTAQTGLGPRSGPQASLPKWSPPLASGMGQTTPPTELPRHPTPGARASSTFPTARERAEEDQAAGALFLQRAQLTRRNTGHLAKQQLFTAIDLETTGLEPPYARACEVGLVKFRGDGTVVDESSTLIRCLGSTEEARDVHGISEDEISDAPEPLDVWQEIFDFANGTVLVAHNLDFEEKFILDEASRLKIAAHSLPAICTLSDSRRHLEGRAFSLKSMHRTATGEWRDDGHQALGDARATKDLLLWLIDSCPSTMFVTHPPTPTPRFMSGPKCTIRPRAVALDKPTINGFLRSLPQSPTPRVGDARAVAAYRELIEEVLDDGRLTYDEVQRLAGAARLTGLTGTQLREVHRQAWQEAFPEPDERPGGTRRARSLAAEALGLEVEEGEASGGEREPAAAPPRHLRGKRLAFFGESERIQEMAARAEANGAPTVKNITKTVLWLAADDVEADTRFHRRARELGLEILDLDSAERRLRDLISDAELQDFQRAQELAAIQARYLKYEAERDEYWRHSWRSRELERDPGPADPWN